MSRNRTREGLVEIRRVQWTRRTTQQRRAVGGKTSSNKNYYCLDGFIIFIVCVIKVNTSSVEGARSARGYAPSKKRIWERLARIEGRTSRRSINIFTIFFFEGTLRRAHGRLSSTRETRRNATLKPFSGSNENFGNYNYQKWERAIKLC